MKLIRKQDKAEKEMVRYAPLGHPNKAPRKAQKYERQIISINSSTSKKLKRKIEKLKSPNGSIEFLEHMLHQTIKVEDLGARTKCVGKITGVIAALAILFAFFQFVALSGLKNEYEKVLSEKLETHTGHGPIVQSSNMAEFELMQNISDAFSNQTEFDKYVDESNGQINLNQICQALSASLWGLVMAKARHTFQISDLVHLQKVKAKYSKIFYMGLMILFAQILKYSADHNLAKNAVNMVEGKIDEAFEKQDHPNRPRVSSSLTQNYSDSPIESIAFSQFLTCAGSLLVGMLSVSAVITSRKYMTEKEKLHILNELYQKPNARVAIGEAEGQNILESIAQSLENQGDQSSDDEEKGERSEQKKKVKKIKPLSKPKKIKKIKPVVKSPEYSNAPEGTSIYPSLNYSLCEHPDSTNNKSIKQHQQRVLELEKLYQHKYDETNWNIMSAQKEQEMSNMQIKGLYS